MDFDGLFNILGGGVHRRPISRHDARTDHTGDSNTHQRKVKLAEAFGRPRHEDQGQRNHDVVKSLQIIGAAAGGEQAEDPQRQAGEPRQERQTQGMMRGS